MGYGMNYGMGNNMPHDYARNGYGVYQTGLSGFTGTLIQLLLITFVIVFIFVVIMWIRNYLIADQYRRGLYQSNPSVYPEAPVKSCSNCKKSLNQDWKVCPYCGKQVNHS